MASVIEHLEAPIDSGGGEVVVEVCRDEFGVYADISTTVPLDDVQFGYKEVEALHKLTADILTVMKNAKVPA